MQEQEFKRHLRDLVHGHHHPEEHDWDGGSGTRSAKVSQRAAKKNTNGKRRVGTKKKR